MTTGRGVGIWVQGARPRTLPAAVVPVAVGAAAAVGQADSVAWGRALLALVVALALQVAVNYANDYSDGVRGTDDERRVGPVRLVGSGLVPAAAVKRAATLAFAAAGLTGLILSVLVGPELLLVGGAAIVAGWTYTGGPKPYGYLGLGELFVFVFFGLVATVGTTYVLLERIDGLSVVASLAVGLWATGLLIINNLRDIPGDRLAGKQTLAVRLGDPATRWLFVATEVGALVAAGVVVVGFGRWAGLLALLGLGPAIQSMAVVRRGAQGRDLIAVLGLAAQVQLISGLGLAVGLAVSG